MTLVGVDVACWCCWCCCWASAAEAEAGAKVRNGVGAASDLWKRARNSLLDASMELGPLGAPGGIPYVPGGGSWGISMAYDPAPGGATGIPAFTASA